MTKEPDETWVVCVGEDDEHSKESVPTKCGVCGSGLWVSPWHIDKKCICKKCVAEKMERGEEELIPEIKEIDIIRTLLHFVRGDKTIRGKNVRKRND